MQGKENLERVTEATQVFRQFAWNLAGTLASARARTKAAPRARGKR